MTEAAAPAPAALSHGAREPIFEAEGVVKRFGGIRAVDGATLRRSARARSPP